jgi:hypothetical protein
MSASRPGVLATIVVAANLAAACGSVGVSPSLPVSGSAAVVPGSSVATTIPPSGSAAAGVPVGFAFAADDIVAYYMTQGFTCASAQPSAKASGFTVRRCQRTDEDGRTRVVGLVTDRDGFLADAFASVRGMTGETVLAPIDALDPLSGFLGATLGETQGAALLTWLASHLGDAHIETTSGPITVATYTASEDDHATLYVELANQTYLEAAPLGP